jgi:hypothetical protein
MANQNILSRSRTRVKKKFLISFFVLGLALSSAFITFDDYQLNLVLAFAFSVIIIHIEKMPRYWRANRSNDIEVIENGLSWSHANKQTTLPFSIPGVFIVVILVVYLVYSIIEARIDKALLGLSVLVSLVNNRQKEIRICLQKTKSGTSPPLEAAHKNPLQRPIEAAFQRLGAPSSRSDPRILLWC